MLDELNHIAQIDAKNTLAVAAGQSEQLRFSDFKLALPKAAKITNIVLAGMGGSALGGLVVRDWLELDVPFEVVRGDTPPSYVDKNSLVIISSYSGNTAETLAFAAAAEKRGAQLIAITAGGELKVLAEKHAWPVVDLPDGYEPRMTVFFNVRVLGAIFEELGLVKGASAELESAAELLATQAQRLVPQVRSDKNQAKQLAEELLGKTAIIYAGPTLAAAAYKWKISLNENAKNLAWCNELPELTHNEIVGWGSHPLEKPFAVVELHSHLDGTEIEKRFELTNRLLSGQMPAPLIVKTEGKNRIEQLLWSIQLGDFVSLYLAVLNGVNPAPVAIIDKLKGELK